MAAEPVPQWAQTAAQPTTLFTMAREVLPLQDVNDMRHKLVQRGFTLIELLVVIVLMSLMTLAFINNQSKFDSSTIMRSLAYSIALSVRQAQVYGVSVQSTGGSFAASHGLYFFVSSTNQSSYALFADNDPSSPNRYAPGADTKEQDFKLNIGFKISEVCAVVNSAVRRCTGSDDSTGTGEITSVDVIFTRPDPDAHIFAYNGTTPMSPAEIYSSAYVKLLAINGDYRFITVANTGQVTVCNINAALGSVGC